MLKARKLPYILATIVAPTLGALSLSATTFAAGTPSSGTINGATALSTITASGLPGGLTIDSASRTWTWDGTGTASTGSFTLTETLTGATNSPNPTTINYTISAASAPDAPVLSNLSSGWTSGDNPPSWQSDYTGVIVYDGAGNGDEIRLRWRFNGGSWTTELAPLDSDHVLADGWQWPTVAAADFSAGGLFEAQEQVARFVGGTETATSAWSNTWSDEITAAAAFNPASLFASGEWGYVFDPSDTSKFWQDSAATVAGAFGSPIGRLDDAYSGASHNFSQATSAKQPTAVSPGWVQFDGVNDLLAFAGQGLFASATGCSIIRAIKAAARTSSCWGWVEESTSSNNPVYSPGTKGDNTVSASQPIVFERNDAGGQNVDSATGITLYDNVAHVHSIVTNVATDETIHSWVDRIAGTDVSYTRTGTLTLNNTSLGAAQRTTEGNWWAGSMGRAVFINRPLTSTERAAVEAWCAEPYGITLP